MISEADLAHYQTSHSSLDILNASDIYLKSANQLIKQYSESASLCFLYLPPPPAISSTQPANGNLDISPNSSLAHQQQETSLSSSPSYLHNQHATALIATSYDSSSNNEHSQRYMKMLDTLSDGLPPCVFVNGVSCVTSTHL